MKSFGFQLLIEQCFELAVADLNNAAVPICARIKTSEIERLFALSLYAHMRFSSYSAKDFLIADDDEQADKLKLSLPSGIIMQTQVQLAGWRVDFLLHCRAHEDANWKKLIVECDGHDFHERTKEQASRDRSRDRNAQMEGFEIFRFTGSELWRDPIGCADQVAKWANK